MDRLGDQNFKENVLPVNAGRTQWSARKRQDAIFILLSLYRYNILYDFITIITVITRRDRVHRSVSRSIQEGRRHNFKVLILI